MRNYLGFAVPLTIALGLGAARELPLVEAVKSQDAKAVRALLQQRADVNATEVDGTTALHWAAFRDDVATADALIKAGANARLANRYGVTPLSLAATNGSAALIERLLEAGADANATLPGGETALMTAARTGKADAVKVLITHGADVNAKEATRGQTALMWAAAEGHADAIRALVEAGAGITAVSHGPANADATGGQSTYRRAQPRSDAFTPMLFAVRAGHIAAVGALLDAGASANETTAEGMSVIVMAAANAHYELAAFLLDKGADPNASKQGWAALHQVARTRTLNIGQFPHPVPTGRISSEDLARTLIAKGADVNQKMSRGFTDEFRGSFNYNGATPYFVAAKGGDAEMMRLMAASGADPQARNVAGTTALMAAAGVDMFNPNEDSGTNADGLACVKVAMGLGADVNATNSQGDTAMHGAAYRGANEIVQLLVDHGARLDTKNKRGFTPLQIANGDAKQLTNIQKRPETVVLLRKMMIDRGLTPEMQSDEEQYSFGVKIK